jgi:putative NADPH-quinone reductase
MSNKVLIMLGHPYNQSYCGGIADTYEKAAKNSGKEVKRLNISDLNFKDYDPEKGHDMELEPDLKKAQELIKWADHLVFVYPTWWAAMPARFKSFFERAFEPGFAFNYHKNDSMWDKLLKGKSAHVFVTMDAPYFIYWLFFGAPGHKMFKKEKMAQKSAGNSGEKL